MSDTQLATAVSDHFVLLVVCACFLMTITLSAITKMVTTASRERSRREIAAYIAEGSMSAEQGERLIRADVNRGPGRT